MARLRRLRRATLVYWGAVALLMFLTIELVDRSTSEARALVRRHGDVQRVWVATRRVDAGSVLSARDVRRAEVPAAFLSSARPAQRPVGQAVTVALSAGEVIVTDRLAPEGLRGAAARMEPGTRALAIPLGPGGPLAVEVGDRVDVLATFPPELAEGEEPTFAVAERAQVVAVDGDAETVTVAVPEADAARVAYAVAVGVVTLALAGWR